MGKENQKHKNKRMNQKKKERDNPSLIVFCVVVLIAGMYMLCKRKSDYDEEDDRYKTKNSFEEFHANTLSSALQSRLQTMSDVEIVAFIRNRILPVHEEAVRAVVFVPGQYSETLNKNIIRICVRDNRGRVFPINTLIHVGLHELAHTCMSEYDPEHSEKFFATFNPLLRKAVLFKIFDPEEKLDGQYMKSCTRKGRRP
jgi:hypothetical protein